MASSSTLLSDMKATLQKLNSPSLKFGVAKKPTAAIDALYEAFLYFRIVKYLQPISSKCQAKLHSNKFVIRLAHSELKSTQTTFSYVRFKIKSEYELHIDTFVDTRAAGARLETDIGVFSAASCDKARGGSMQRPSFNNLWLFVEAKHFGKSISTTVAKSFIGTWCMVGRPKKCFASLVSNQNIDENGVRLVKGAGCRSYGKVLPLKACQKYVTAWENDTRAKLKKL